MQHGFCPRNLEHDFPVWPSPSTNRLVDTECHEEDGHQQDAKDGSHQHCKGKTGYLVEVHGTYDLSIKRAFSNCYSYQGYLLHRVPGRKHEQALTQVTPQIWESKCEHPSDSLCSGKNRNVTGEGGQQQAGGEEAPEVTCTLSSS